ESVHVAGTNGKGSTASLLAAVATASGRRTGLHTSPHLFYLGERLRLDGVPAPPAWIADTVARYRPVLDDLRPSFFEATTALSFLYFAEQGVDLAVVEVGLGGRLDATNVLHPRFALITGIGLDHTALLGDTPADIAREKAGIIKPGVPVLTAADQPEVVEVIRAVAYERQAPLHQLQDEVEVLEAHASLDGSTLRVRTPLRRYDALEVGLPGPHQQTNALLALRAAEVLFDDLHRDATSIYTGLREVRRLAGLHGRLDILRRQPLIVADVAHNLQGLGAALAFLRSQRSGRQSRLFVLLGAMRDKDIAGMARLLADAGATVFPIHLGNERAFLPAKLATVLRKQGVAVVEGGRVAEGWTWFQREATAEDILLITGSHQVVAQIPMFPASSPASNATPTAPRRNR
ncbi:MAG: bifunctional folylpolyglutamate synthase/dihydrofolate synthase, partial [Rhodothermales bacterium]